MVNNVAWGAKSSKSQRSETDSARSGRIPGRQDPEVGKPSDHSWGCTWDDISWVSPWDCNSEKSWDMVPYGALSLYTIVIYIYIYLSTENWNCTSKYGSPRTKGTEVTEEEGTHRIILGNKQYWILPSSSSSLLNRPDVSWMDKHRPPPILPLMLQSFLASTGFLFFFMRVNIIQDIYVHSKTLGL